MVQKKILIVVNNFDIGGIQRLALDQLYICSDLSIYAEAHYRFDNETSSTKNFMTLENKRISQKKLLIYKMPNKYIKQIFYLMQILRKTNFSLIINHDVAAGLQIKIALILTRKVVPTYVFIHQLPSLAPNLQRWKRFIYALCADEIYCYSIAVLKDWNRRLNENYLLKLISKHKRPNLQRNGVYLNRLPKAPLDKKLYGSPRLIFIGRNVPWKNLTLFINLARTLKEFNVNILIIVPDLNSELETKLKKEFGRRISFEIGKKIEDISFYRNDIHIYPVNYGPDAKFIESVSINCLEMACLGIPSLVTQGGLNTWPDLTATSLFHQLDWSDLTKYRSIVKDIMRQDIKKNEISRTRKIISIENNIMALLSKKYPKN